MKSENNTNYFKAVSIIFFVLAWGILFYAPILNLNDGNSSTDAISYINIENGISISDSIDILKTLSETVSARQFETKFSFRYEDYIFMLILTVIHIISFIVLYVNKSKRSVNKAANIITGVLLCFWLVNIGHFADEFSMWFYGYSGKNFFEVNWLVIILFVWMYSVSSFWYIVYCSYEKEDTAMSEVICPVCKKKNEKYAMYCGMCGSPINAAGSIYTEKYDTVKTAKTDKTTKTDKTVETAETAETEKPKSKSTASETTEKVDKGDETEKAKSKVKYSTFGSEKKYQKVERNKKRLNVDLTIIFSSEEFDMYLKKNMYRCRMCDSENTLESTVCQVCGSNN